MSILVITGIMVAVIFVASIYYIIRVFRKKDTKSRFAFFALTSVSSIVTLIVISLLSGQTPIQSILFLASQIFGFNYAPKGPSSIELVVLCFVTWLLYSLSKSIFKNWDGLITVEQHKSDIRQEEALMLLDGCKELKRIVNREPQKELYIKDDKKPIAFTLKTPEDSLIWHIQACELVCLARPDYFFDTYTGWRETESFWYGETKNKKTPIILYCFIKDKPDLEILSDIWQLMATNTNYEISNIEVVVAIKEGGV